MPNIDPPVAFIVFLAVTDEDVVFKTRDYASHVNGSDP
jgi:hypothetical protein